MKQLIRSKKWTSSAPPKRILVIRLQAIGDVTITFPFVQYLKNCYPEISIDFLSRAVSTKSLHLLTAIDNVIPFTNSHTRFQQLLFIVKLLPRLLLRRYDIVLDLQSNKVSKLIRTLLAPKSFTEFERFTPASATERIINALTLSGLVINFEHQPLKLKNAKATILALPRPQSEIVILNPAGAFSSRNWPLENYIEFARHWLQLYPATTFIMLGLPTIKPKAVYLKRSLGESFVDLVGKTTLDEAFYVVKEAVLMVSEDSGLMHIAWALKIPTIALIGSTDKNRSAQPGKHLVALTSDDLACGNCMKPDCPIQEIPPCLSRYSPEMVVKIADHLLQTLRQ